MDSKVHKPNISPTQSLLHNNIGSSILPGQGVDQDHLPATFHWLSELHRLCRASQDNATRSMRYLGQLGHQNPLYKSSSGRGSDEAHHINCHYCCQSRFQEDVGANSCDGKVDESTPVTSKMRDELHWHGLEGKQWRYFDSLQRSSGPRMIIWRTGIIIMEVVKILWTDRNELKGKLLPVQGWVLWATGRNSCGILLVTWNLYMEHLQHLALPAKPKTWKR